MRFVEGNYWRVRDVEIEKPEVFANGSHVEHHGQVHLETDPLRQEVDRDLRFFIRYLSSPGELECDFAYSIRHNWHVNDDVLPRFYL